MSRPPMPAPYAFRLPDPPGCCFPGGVAAHLHRPAVQGARARAGVLVLPITGGDYGPSTLFADDLACAGFTALRLERRAEWLFSLGDGKGEAREPEAITALAAAFLADAHAALAWLRAEGGIDPARVGVLGISLGAAFAARVAADDPSVAAAVLLLGGAGLADMVASARDREVRQYRDALRARHGLTHPALVERLHMGLAPADHTPHLGRLDPARVLMVSGRFDAVVNRAASDRLWEGAGRPLRRFYPAGHYSALLFLPWIKRWTRAWLDARLGTAG